MIAEEMYEIDISDYIEKDWITYEYDSFTRGYHAYLSIWNQLVGETLKCRQEPSNEVVDKNAVAIIRSDPREKETIVQVSQNISKTCSMFQKVPDASIEVQVARRRLNH